MAYVYKDGKGKFETPIRDATRKTGKQIGNAMKKVARYAVKPVKTYLKTVDKAMTRREDFLEQRNRQMILDNYGSFENYEKEVASFKKNSKPKRYK